MPKCFFLNTGKLVCNQTGRELQLKVSLYVSECLSALLHTSKPHIFQMCWIGDELARTHPSTPSSPHPFPNVSKPVKSPKTTGDFQKHFQLCRCQLPFASTKKKKKTQKTAPSKRNKPYSNNKDGNHKREETVLSWLGEQRSSHLRCNLSVSLTFNGTSSWLLSGNLWYTICHVNQVLTWQRRVIPPPPPPEVEKPVATCESHFSNSLHFNSSPPQVSGANFPLKTHK